MRCRYFLPLALFMLLFAGCAAENYYAQAVYSWKGATTKALFQRWGYPDRIARLPSGHRLLMYRKISPPKYPPHVTPGFAGGTTQKGTVEMARTSRELSGGRHQKYKCTAWFEVNKKERIVVTSYRGNHCVASKEFLTTYSRR